MERFDRADDQSANLFPWKAGGHHRFGVNQVPRTSVIIPVRNGSAHIAAALNSALPQLSEQDELIVVVDACTDDTLEKLEPFLPRIKLIEGPGKGPSIARNLGLAAAEVTH